MHMTDKPPLSERDLAFALDRVLRRLADKGWLASRTIREGKMHVEYTELGRKRMGTLKRILTQELHAALTYEEFCALTGLMLLFQENPEAQSASEPPA